MLRRGRVSVGDLEESAVAYVVLCRLPQQTLANSVIGTNETERKAISQSDKAHTVESVFYELLMFFSLLLYLLAEYSAFLILCTCLQTGQLSHTLVPVQCTGS